MHGDTRSADSAARSNYSTLNCRDCVKYTVGFSVTFSVALSVTFSNFFSNYSAAADPLHMVHPVRRALPHTRHVPAVAIASSRRLLANVTTSSPLFFAHLFTTTCPYMYPHAREILRKAQTDKGGGEPWRVKAPP